MSVIKNNFRSVKVSLVDEFSFSENIRIDSMANLLNKLSHPMSYVYEWFPFIGKVYDGKMQFPFPIDHQKYEKITFKSLLRAVQEYQTEFEKKYLNDEEQEQMLDSELYNYPNIEIVLKFLKLFNDYSVNTIDLMVNMNVVNHQIYLEDNVKEDNIYNDIIFLRNRYSQDDNVDMYIIRQMMKFMENKVTLEKCTLEDRSYIFEGIEYVKMYDYIVYELIWGS